eukprot:TRINITY_DN3128_c0_g1_i4.p1 TRINITY_DN3128_c0_g1~~TRINITY_DN3128_c0_g1_i4.p1  ORF type:complete len:627 (-),score=320.06 TRINITY_DN3128_c0_g1_i4:116-1744(-)
MKEKIKREAESEFFVAKLEWEERIEEISSKYQRDFDQLKGEKEDLVYNLTRAFQSKAEALEEVKKMLMEEMKEGEVSMQRASNRMKYQLEEIEELSAEVRTANEEIFLLEDKLDTSERQREKLESELENLRREIQVQEEIIKRLEASLLEREEENKGLRKELKEQKDRIQQLEEAYEEILENDAQAMNRISDLKSNMTDQLVKTQTVIEEQTKVQREELDILEKQLEIEREYLSSIQKQYEEQFSGNQQLETFREFAEDYMDRTHDESINREKRINQLEMAVSSANYKLEMSLAELETTKEHLEECKEREMENQLAISKLKIELHDKKAEIEFLEQRASIEIKLNRALVRLNQDSSNTYKLLQDMDRLVHDTPAESNIDIISELQKEVHTRGHEVQLLTDRIEEKDEQIETLKKLLQTRKEKNQIHVENVGKFYESQLKAVLSSQDVAYANRRLDLQGNEIPLPHLYSPEPTRAPASTPNLTPAHSQQRKSISNIPSPSTRRGAESPLVRRPSISSISKNTPSKIPMSPSRKTTSINFVLKV